MLASTTDSARNCISTCQPFAPTAMRVPISRVRSVTETSMMFMIPMPPTSSEIDAIAASSTRITRAVDPTTSAQVLLRAHREVVVLAGREPVPRAQQLGDVRRRLGDVVERGGRRCYVVDKCDSYCRWSNLFSALALGPIVEHFLMNRGITF